MSISSPGLPTLAAATEVNPGSALAVLLVILFFTALAFILALRFGVFRRTDIVGPDRLPRQGAGMLLLVFFITLVIWMCTQTAYLGYRQAQWRHGGMKDIPTNVESLLTTQDWATLSTVPPMIGFFVMLSAGALLNRGWLDRLGIAPAKFRRGILGGIIGFLIAGPLVFCTLILLNVFYQLIQFEHPTEHVLLKSLGEADHRGAGLLIALGATLCAPLFEEFLFRGHLQTLFRQMLMRMYSKPMPVEAAPAPVSTLEAVNFGLSLPPALPVLVVPRLLQPAPWHGWVAILLTSLIFAGFHPLWMWPPIFVLSLGLGYVYERTGNLWATITIHCLFNSLETVQYLMLMRGR